MVRWRHLNLYLDEEIISALCSRQYKWEIKSSMRTSKGSATRVEHIIHLLLDSGAIYCLSSVSHCLSHGYDFRVTRTAIDIRLS
jgi:hypothetical protein